MSSQDPITSLVVILFSTPGTALLMASAILIFAFGLIIKSSLSDYRPLLSELNERWNMLSGLQGRSRHKAFFSMFTEIDNRFNRSSQTTLSLSSLVSGWANYRSFLVDNEHGEFITSLRASEAFDRLDESARSLEWWANILVAVGLVITFLGIVAALSEATSAMASGKDNQAAMQSALMGLLAIAATKFWTSIAGVLASIILRVVARFRRRAIELFEANLFMALEACIQFMPPETVSIEQLKSLRRLEMTLSLDQKAA
jgi:flagellar motor component MotA